MSYAIAFHDTEVITDGEDHREKKIIHGNEIHIKEYSY